MGNCDRFLRSISDLVDGELQGVEKHKLEEHLQTCRQCSELVTKLRLQRIELRRLPRLRTSADFDAVLRARIRLNSGFRQRSFGGRLSFVPWRVPALAVGVLLLVIVATVGVTMLSHRKSNILVQPSQNFDGTYWTGGVEGRSLAQDSIEVMVNYVLERVPLQQLLSVSGIPLSSDGMRATLDTLPDSLNRDLDSKRMQARLASGKKSVSF